MGAWCGWWRWRSAAETEAVGGEQSGGGGGARRVAWHGGGRRTRPVGGKLRKRKRLAPEAAARGILRARARSRRGKREGGLRVVGSLLVHRVGVGMGASRRHERHTIRQPQGSAAGARTPWRAYGCSWVAFLVVGGCCVGDGGGRWRSGILVDVLWLGLAQLLGCFIATASWRACRGAACGLRVNECVDSGVARWCVLWCLWRAVG